jgi:hypothetical protein
MLKREAHPETFTEREDEEEVIPGFPMRIVGRVEREVQCAGGIIADDVGFGKTVLTLAVIDHQRQHDADDFVKRERERPSPGPEPLKATLIIVPDHIVEQWKSEIRRFLGPAFRVETFRTFASLKPSHISNLRGANVVLVSDKMFAEKKYKTELSRWAGIPEVISTSDNPTDRAYCAWYRQCVCNIRQYLKEFQADSQNDARKRLADRILADSDSRENDNKDIVTNHVLPESSRKSKKEEQAPEQPEKRRSSSGVDCRTMFMEEVMLLEFFSFTRLVWDEMSYHNVPVAQFAAMAPAAHKWLLSGTPPRQNLKDLDYMAKVLGISLARPVDLRLGLPRITQGPSMSNARTKIEEGESCGKMKSDKFVKDRHQQGQNFLLKFSCSNTAPALQTKVVEHVVVCSPELQERAFYEYKQQELRNVQMAMDNLPPGSRSLLLEHMGRKNGDDIPDDAVPMALVFAASVPHIASEDLSVALVHKQRLEQLNDTKIFVKRVFDLVIWLAQRLEQCKWMAQSKGKGKGKGKGKSKGNVPTASEPPDDDDKELADKMATDIKELTVTIRRRINGLEDGRFGIFGGQNTFFLLLQALIPELKFDEDRLVRQARSEVGLDVVQLRCGKLAEKTPLGRGPGEHMYILNQLYLGSTTVWSDYYVINKGDISNLNENNLVSLVQEYINRRPSTKVKFDANKNRTQDDWIDYLKVVLNEIVTETDALNAAAKKEPSAEFMSNLKALNKAQLESCCRQRGLKYASSAPKQSLHDLIVEDESGGASAEKYTGLCMQALKPTQCVPIMDQKKSVRGTETGETREAFKQATNTFDAAIDLLHQHGNHARRAGVFCKLENREELQCRDCERHDELSIILECGHILCEGCREGRESCGDGTTLCPTVLKTSVAPVSRFKTGPRVLKLPGSNHTFEDSAHITSRKIKCIVDLVQQIPSKEKVVIFTKYERVIWEIMEALKERHISNRSTTELNSDKSGNKDSSKTLESFKKGTFQVLVQKLDSSEAAGSNLTVANHVIFATPLVTDCQEIYDTCMKQAKGRCARRGQKLDVHIYHCVTEGTFEVDMLECRTKREIRVQPGLSLGHLVAPGTREKDLEGRFGYDSGKPKTQRVNSNLSTAEV